MLLSTLLLSASILASDVTYTIPAGASLKDPLTLSVSEAYFLQSDDEVEMGFRLPEGINGKHGKFFTLSGLKIQNRVLLEGDSVEASCESQASKTDCVVSFKKLELGQSKIDNINNTLPQDILENIQAGREALEHQAIGVITFHHDISQAKD